MAEFEKALRYWVKQDGVDVAVTAEETYEREFGNLKSIRDNYPKYVVTMDPNVGLIHDSGIVACSARQFLLNLEM